MAPLPWAIDPAQGFLLNANNDPGGISTDGDLMDDPYYIGGPWLEGYRADTIEKQLQLESSSQTASIQSMQELQANHQSRFGEQFVPHLVQALNQSEQFMTAGETEGTQGRMAQLFMDNEDDFIAVRERLSEWCARGCWAASGVFGHLSWPRGGSILARTDINRLLGDPPGGVVLARTPPIWCRFRFTLLHRRAVGVCLGVSPTARFR